MLAKEVKLVYKGKLVILRAFEQKDLEDNHRFVNDASTALDMLRGFPLPSSYSDESQWLSQQTSYTRGEYQFAVDNQDGCLVGRCGLIKVDWKNRSGEVAIMIGREWRGRGYGSDALRVLCAFCFDQMNIHHLKVTVLGFNTAAIHCYLACGFQKEGVLREDVFRNGAYSDAIVLGLLEDEWRRGSTSDS